MDRSHDRTQAGTRDDDPHGNNERNTANFDSQSDSRNCHQHADADPHHHRDSHYYAHADRLLYTLPPGNLDTYSFRDPDSHPYLYTDFYTDLDTDTFSTSHFHLY